jgi:hypothetical protein
MLKQCLENISSNIEAVRAGFLGQRRAEEGWIFGAEEGRRGGGGVRRRSEEFEVVELEVVEFEVVEFEVVEFEVVGFEMVGVHHLIYN